MKIAEQHIDPTYRLNGGFKPNLERTADRDGPDFFPTPAWAGQALVENEALIGDIWESACGDGSMARVLEQTGTESSALTSTIEASGRLGTTF